MKNLAAALLITALLLAPRTVARPAAGAPVAVALTTPAPSGPGLSMQATFVVDSAMDSVDAAPGDGVCATATGACTLRAAIQESNALAGPDEIILPAGTYNLTLAGANEDAAATGDLDIADSLTLTGADMHATIVDGSAAGDRVFHVLGGVEDLLENLTIRGGRAPDGGGVYAGVTLHLRHTVLEGNRATGGGRGGGLYSAALSTLHAVEVMDNQAVGGQGGGIYNQSGFRVLMHHSTVANNTAGQGAGIYTAARLNIENSTISGNVAETDGGGIYHQAGIITFNTSTLTANSAAQGGGIGASTESVTLDHAILYGNSAGVGGPDCSGSFTSAGYNLIGSDSGCSFVLMTGDQVGVDPLLTPLQDNGGPTPTHAPLSGSPAIDGGNPAGCTNRRGELQETDQRGLSRPLDGDGDGEAICDIGAVEIEGPSGPDFGITAMPADQTVCAPADAIYDVTVSSMGGYAEQVTLSAGGLPGGTTASFSVNPVIAPGTSALTVGNTAAAVPGDYSINVSGVDVTRTHTATVGLVLLVGAPAEPALLSPPDGATGQPVRPTLKWKDSGQATSYSIEIATDPDFTNVVDSASGLPGTSYIPGVSLSEETVHYWRVSAVNTCGESNPSVVFSFTTTSGAFTVNSAVDAVDAQPGDGACATAAGACTLRAAIQESNALAGAHTIILPAGTYTLTLPGGGEHAALTGDLDIGGEVTLLGAGAGMTVVDGNGLVTRDRVFHVFPLARVTFTALTIRGGIAQDGGGIHSRGTVTITESILTGNESSGTLFSGGGAIYNDGTMTVEDSAIWGNAAADRGSGIYNDNGPAVLVVRNSTISSNNAGHGAGIFNTWGSTQLSNVTLVFNSVVWEGGGVYLHGGTLTIRDTIIYGNSAGRNAPDCWGPLASAGYNILGTNSGCSFVRGTGDQLGVNPLLGPLQDNGGPTQTHALLDGSPAIDTGNPVGCADEQGVLLTTDQRGYVRPVDGNGDGNAFCDIGSYEYGATPP